MNIKKIMLLAAVVSLLALLSASTSMAGHLDGLVGYWAMDEGLGKTANDSSGHVNHGELSGGIDGNAVELDGTGDFVEAPYAASLDIPGSLTVEAWVRLDTNNTVNTVVSKDTSAGIAETNYNLHVFQNHVTLFVSFVDGGTTVSAPTLGFAACDTTPGCYIRGATDFVDLTNPLGTWRHIAGVYELTDTTTGTLRVYLDGTLDGEVAINTTNGTPRTNTSSVRIGTRKFGANDVHGRIDEVRISSAALYVANFAPTAPLAAAGNTAGWWHMDDSVGSTASDSSGNGNTGTFQGNATWAGPTWNSSLSFDGVDDYVSSMGQVMASGPFTVALWMKSAFSQTSLSAPISQGHTNADGFGLQFRSYDAPFLAAQGLGNPRTFEAYPSSETGWHHVAITHASDNTNTVYVDGVNVLVRETTSGPTYGSAAFSWTAPFVPSTYELYFGQDFSNAGRFWDGNLDEVQIYDRALSLAEIRSVALTGATGTLYVDDDGEVGLGSVDCNGTGFTVYSTIQDAVDAASTGNTILVCPGTYNEAVVISTDGLTLSGIAGSKPVLDGTGVGGAHAISLTDGLHGLIIEGFEIRNYTSNPRSSGIQAWDMATSNVIVRYNEIHDNTWNGVLVGSEGGYIHTNWMVTDNSVHDHEFGGIELTNCSNCKIMHNSLTANGIRSIIVQARNTTPGGPKVEIHAVDVLHNAVNSTGDKYGIYVLTYEGITTLPFDPIGVMSELTSVTINNNTVSGIGAGEYGVRFWAYNSGTLAKNATINHNVFTCTPTLGTGVRVEEDGSAGSTVENVKVMNNSISGCDEPVDMEPGTGKANNN